MEKITKLIIERKKELDSKIEKANLSVCDSGLAYINEDWHCADVLSVYSRIYYIIEGYGAHIAGKNEEIEMLPGHIYLIPSGYQYRYWCDGCVKKVYFHINIKREDGYDSLANFGRLGELSDPAKVERIAALYENGGANAAFALKGELFDTVAAMAKKYSFDLSEGDGSKYSKTLRMATGYIQKNLSVKLTRASIAQYCGVSCGTVAKCFKGELGVSMGKYIDDLIFIEASRRLIYTDDPIGRISDDLGFCDQFYFSRRFSELYSISPIKFRAQMQRAR